MNRQSLLTVDLRYEQDVVSTRQRARQIAMLLGFTAQDQTSFATAVSEIARNAFRYGGGGKVEFAIEDLSSRPVMTAHVRDKGPGIANLQQILDGQYRSQTGMGMGIIGSKRLSDRFDITSNASGTAVLLGKQMPRGALLTSQNLAKLAEDLVQRTPQSPVEEIQQQNRELLIAMDDLHRRQSEVERLNVELAETNRGVLALYAELDDKAVALANASDLKSRFLSDMSHELRTPLNAMISISRLLIDRTDGELTDEQDKQVRLIHKSGESLRDMVNELLDLAKIEAGKTEVHAAEFTTTDLLSALRGLFRPLIGHDGAVILAIDDPAESLTLYSDEQKVAQILRNFVSNALKFTERGEVRVDVREGAGDTVMFLVSDTGIGIADGDAERVFRDYEQVDSTVQRRQRGTGLGLPLSRKLARLLGGDVGVRSEPGVGSVFTLTLPRRFDAETVNRDAQS